MLSPASPSAQRPAPAPASSGRKTHHFALLFSSKIFGEREIMVFQNRKNKIVFGPKIFRERIKSDRFLFVIFSVKFHAFLESHSRWLNIQGAIAALDPPSFFDPK